MNFKRNTNESGGGFQMAPMLDIVFILLIHFMAATIFAQWENKMEIQVPTASAAERQTRQPGEVILNIDKDGQVFINSRAISDERLLNLLNSISREFKSQPIILRADRATDCQQLIRVLDICKQADIWNIAFATVAPSADGVQQ